MRNRKNLSESEDSTDINISPLIDMVFILLIFFIVTTVFVEEQGLAAKTPDPAPPTTNQDEDKHLVSFLVRTNGEVLYTEREGNTRSVRVSEIRGIVEPEMRGNLHPITVKVEPEALMHLVVKIIDECELGGAEQVTMKAVQAE